MLSMSRFFMTIAALILTVSFVITDGSSEFLRFIDVPKSNKSEIIYLDDRYFEVLLDAVSTTSRNVYFLGTNVLTTHKVKFACKTAPRSASLSNIKLCCRPDALQPRSCYSLVSKLQDGFITCGRSELSYKYNIHEGALFELSFSLEKSRDFAHSGIISCSLSDADSLIESNEIEFRDSFFYANQLGIRPENTVQTYSKPITISDFPLPFKCGDFGEKMSSWPYWISSVWDKLSPYEWGYCSVGGSNTPSVCASSAKYINIGDGITAMDGTLFLLTPNLLQSHPDSALVCRMKLSKAPIRTFASSSTAEDTPEILKGFSIDDKASSQDSDELVGLTPKSSTFLFVDGTQLFNFKLQAFYRKPINRTTTFSWYKDGVSLTGDKSEYSLSLIGRVDRNTAGRYELVVSSLPSKELRFTFIVNVVGPPKFLNAECIYDNFYAMEATSYTINCNIGAGKSDIKVGINGLESQTPDGLRSLLKNSLDFAIQPISQLNIDFSIGGDEITGRSILVTANNLQPEQNFRLVIKASNENGQSQLAGNVHVVPKPILSIAPKQMSCESNCDIDRYRVQCVVKKSIVNQWQDKFGLLFVQDWLIDGTGTRAPVENDQSVSQYFNVNSSNPTQIEISPLRPFSPKSDANMTLQETFESKAKKSLPDLTIECRIRLYVTNSWVEFEHATLSTTDGSRRIRSINDDDNKLIYDSYFEEDAEVKSILQAKRHYGVAQDQPAMSGLSWILAVIISGIILLSVVGLSVWMCAKNRGESYNAYHKELKIGNDPLMELKGNCSFQPFERPEGPPILINRCSLDEESVHFGSDDDGELDDYNLDPGTFNEAASYIGQYIPRDVPETLFSHDISTLSGHQTAV